MPFEQLVELISKGILESLYMTLTATLISYIFGILLGIVLTITGDSGICKCKIVYVVVGFIVNVFRSIPFLILIVFIIPFTKALVGKSIGTTATIVPLTVAAIPFIARMVESSLSEVKKGVIEASTSMGASKLQIIFKVLLPEAKTSLLVGFAITITTILGYSAMAGAVGGGGLGQIAINYGYYRYNKEIMLITVVLLVAMVQGFQAVGMTLAKKLDKRQR